MRKIAISDIHGCAATFRAMVEEQVKLKKEDELFLLGDYVDRGPDSKGVFDYIWHLQDEGYTLRCLKGNHEEMMVNASSSEEDLELWLVNGGKATLASFDAENLSQIPGKYLNFMDELDYYAESEEYILVHAGLNFDQRDPLTPGNDMLWSRWWYDEIDWKWLEDRIIVHGHTPIEMRKIRQMHKNLEKLQVLDIDNGCFATFQRGMGQLCAFEMTHKRLYFQPNIDY